MMLLGLLIFLIINAWSNRGIFSEKTEIFMPLDDFLKPKIIWIQSPAGLEIPLTRLAHADERVTWVKPQSDGWLLISEDLVGTRIGGVALVGFDLRTFFYSVVFLAFWFLGLVFGPSQGSKDRAKDK